MYGIFYEKKSETLSKFNESREKVESDLDKKIWCLCTNNGREYVSYEFDIYLKKYNIQRQLTFLNIPQ
jgi:hypothetical protein